MSHETACLPATPVRAFIWTVHLTKYFQSPLLWLKFCSYLSFLCPALTAPRVETKRFGRPAASSGSAWSDPDLVGGLLHPSYRGPVVAECLPAPAALVPEVTDVRDAVVA